MHLSHKNIVILTKLCVSLETMILFLYFFVFIILSLV